MSAAMNTDHPSSSVPAMAGKKSRWDLLPRLELRPSLKTGAAAAVIAAYYFIRFRSCVLTFFTLDDFWLLRRAAAINVRSLADIAQLLRLNVNGFLLYRPLSQGGYFYLLRQMFGLDASGYHAFQLAIHVINATLVFGIARRLTASTSAALAAALLYAGAPGHLSAIYWMAAFTMTGTALVVLSTVYVWLATEGTAHAAWYVVLQVIGLLMSEHAIAMPVLLAIAATFGAGPKEARRVVRKLAVPTILVCAYVGLKMCFLPPLFGPALLYAPRFDTIGWLERLGRYASVCFSVSRLPVSLLASGPGATVCVAVGLLTLGLTGMAAWQAFRGRSQWRLLAFGSCSFIAGVLPVLPLRDHYFDYYIGIGAMGAAVGAVGAWRLLSRSWRQLGAGVVAAIVALDVLTSGPVAGKNQYFDFLQAIATGAASWVASVEQAGRDQAVREVDVPDDGMTRLIFVAQPIQELFTPRTAVVLYDPTKPPQPKAGLVILRTATPLRPGDPLPQWQPRWRWLRRCAGWRGG